MIQDKAMLVSLKITMLGTSKKDKDVTESANNQYNAQQDAGYYSKKLIAKEDMAELKQLTGKARKFHQDYTLQWSDNNERMLPSKNYLDYTNGLSEFKNDFEIAVDEFVRKYPDMIIKQEKTLGAMFCRDDYIDQSDIKNEFSFKYEVKPIPNADDFRISLGEEEMKKIKEQLKKDSEERTKAAMKALWERLYNNITNMEEQLGKEKGRIFDSLLGNTKELTKLLAKMNITNDEKLEKIRVEIEDRLCGYETNEIRKQPQTRKEALESAKAIKKDIANAMGIA